LAEETHTKNVVVVHCHHHMHMPDVFKQCE
jgi:hypothetical protein